MFGFIKQNRLNKKLSAAAREGNIADIAQLLDAGAQIETEDSTKWNMTPLSSAGYHNRFPAVRLLLDRGANIEARDRVGDTPLMNAVQGDCAEAVTELLKRGADVEAQNNTGATAASLARRKANRDLYRIICPSAEPPAPPPAPEIGSEPDEIVLKRKIGDKILEEVFNFSARERISLVRTEHSGPVEAMTRENFDEISERVLRRAFAVYAGQGGAIPEAEVFPNAMAKVKPQPRAG